MIYIVIPVFNRWSYTNECLLSLQKQTYNQFKIIVVDHGSTDGTSDHIKKHFPEIILVKGDASLWWTGATNLGVKKALSLSKADDDFVLTLNNDLEVDESYLQELLNVYEKSKPCLVGSTSVDIHSRKKIHYGGTIWNNITAKYTSAIDLTDSLHQVQQRFHQISTDLLPGRGVLIPIVCFRHVGLYDERHFPHYMADEEFALRCKKNGYKLLIASKAVVYSYINETGLKQQYFQMNFAYWKALFLSIKSPNNLMNRWKWANIVTPIPILYFIFDISRILYSQIKRFK